MYNYESRLFTKELIEYLKTVQQYMILPYGMFIARSKSFTGELIWIPEKLCCIKTKKPEVENSGLT